MFGGHGLGEVEKSGRWPCEWATTHYNVGSVYNGCIKDVVEFRAAYRQHPRLSDASSVFGLNRMGE